MSEDSLRVLILCTGNSARSILGEFLLRDLAQGDVTAPGEVTTFSAGSVPSGRVHPLALEVLAGDYGLSTEGASSQAMSEFAEEPFDLVITVCDSARDRCPLWLSPGQRTHWGLPDPAAVTGDRSTRRAAFEETARILSLRFREWLALEPGQRLDSKRLKNLSKRF